VGTRHAPVIRLAPRTRRWRKLAAAAIAAVERQLCPAIAIGGFQRQLEPAIVIVEQQPAIAVVVELQRQLEPPVAIVVELVVIGLVAIVRQQLGRLVARIVVEQRFVAIVGRQQLGRWLVARIVGWSLRRRRRTSALNPRACAAAFVTGGHHEHALHVTILP
jgi:hypothetical protein